MSTTAPMDPRTQLLPTPDGRRWNANRTLRRAPSPFLGGGEKVAAGRMRGGATNADAHNPSPQPSPLLRGRERESECVATPRYSTESHSEMV